MSSWENSARITSRIASVATTRTMPRRVASWAARVLGFPPLVAPPISTTSGTFKRLDLAPALEVPRVPLASRHLLAGSHCSRRGFSPELHARDGQARLASWRRRCWRSPWPPDRPGRATAPITMTCDAIRPLEYGRPESRSEIRICEFSGSFVISVRFSGRFALRRGRSSPSTRSEGPCRPPTRRRGCSTKTTSAPREHRSVARNVDRRGP